MLGINFNRAFLFLALFMGVAPGSQVQAQMENAISKCHLYRNCKSPDRDPSPQTCIPQDRYPEGQVQICLDCTGRLYVNGIRVSVPDLDLVLSRLKTTPKPLHYKVIANTDAEMSTYLKVRSLMDTHEISPEYKITLASRRSLCR